MRSRVLLLSDQQVHPDMPGLPVSYTLWLTVALPGQMVGGAILDRILMRWLHAQILRASILGWGLEPAGEK